MGFSGGALAGEKYSKGMTGRYELAVKRVDFLNLPVTGSLYSKPVLCYRQCLANLF